MLIRDPPIYCDIEKKIHKASSQLPRGVEPCKFLLMDAQLGLITFKTTWDPSWLPLSLSKRYGLCPALLRANKRVRREASLLLYSGNRFGFSDLDPTPRLDTKSAVLASFLSQVERQNASFLCYVCIDFPAFDDCRPGSASSRKIVLKGVAEAIEHCTLQKIFLKPIAG